MIWWTVGLHPGDSDSAEDLIHDYIGHDIVIYCLKHMIG